MSGLLHKAYRAPSLYAIEKSREAFFIYQPKG